MDNSDSSSRSIKHDGFSIQKLTTRISDVLFLTFYNPRDNEKIV